MGWFRQVRLVSGWTNPSEKILVNLDHFPHRSGVNIKNYLSCHHRIEETSKSQNSTMQFSLIAVFNQKSTSPQRCKNNILLVVGSPTQSRKYAPQIGSWTANFRPTLEMHAELKQWPSPTKHTIFPGLHSFRQTMSICHVAQISPQTGKWRVGIFQACNCFKFLQLANQSKTFSCYKKNLWVSTSWRQHPKKWTTPKGSPIGVFSPLPTLRRWFGDSPWGCREFPTPSLVTANSFRSSATRWAWITMRKTRILTEWFFIGVPIMGYI